ncbi:MAG: RNA polymerase subunit sigma [Blastocatellia bacterium]|nr:MAG: RNA polymerase subunit sigma [Blastocatellia bacterium]
MRLAQAGDRDAYTELLTFIAPRIRRMIRRRRRFLSVDDVEDLVQDVLLSVHQVRATYDPSRPFFPWLFAIVTHRLADAGRRYGRRDAHEVELDEQDVTFADLAANTVDESVGDVEALEQAIRSLPTGQRQAIKLLKLQELSLKEASAVTGLGIGALKVATHRAMVALRRALRPTANHED